MKVSYNWLKEHLPLELPAQDLARRLVELGFEVSSLEKRGPAFSGVVAAEILEVSRHPNADRLSLCTVTDGSRKYSVVCGAPNVARGQKVPLARVGAKLPGGREITPALIRGAESQGMLCSSAELGLGVEANGILVLDPKTETGQDISKSAGPSDDILDVEITPNRPDCLSHLGLARELSAALGRPLKTRPSLETGTARGECPPVKVDAPQACPRYLGRAFSELRIGPSPGWLAAKLEAVGLRPVNNLVDITNFILLDLGQPLHAFDLDRLEGGRIVVRFAQSGERIMALDNREYALSSECLVIADSKKPVAVAGVMGGLESAVTAKTSRAFLESAHFAPSVVRRTSQLLRLRSDSSYRFERGCDPMAVPLASSRACELILKLCGPQAQGSAPLNVGQTQAEASPIALGSRRINEILGSDFGEEPILRTLKAISARLETEGGRLKFTPPSWRSDLATAWDLAEEVARLLGYDSIPPKASRIPPLASLQTPAQTLIERCRARLAGLGLWEAYNYDMVSERQLRQSRIQPGPGLVRLANPLSEDWTALRPTLLIGLLKNAASNLRNGAATVRLFEIGKVYARTADRLDERLQAAGLLLGPVAGASWKPGRSPRSGVYDAKGIVEELLSGVQGLSWRFPLAQAGDDQAPSERLFHAATAQGILLEGHALGAVGLLHPQTARHWDLAEEEATLFYLDLDLLLGAKPAPATFKPYSLLPPSKRDLSFVLPETTLYEDVLAALREPPIEALRAVDLIDVFAGPRLGAGKKSLTLRLTFGRDDRTLADEEVNAAVEKILGELDRRFGAVLRG